MVVLLESGERYDGSGQQGGEASSVSIYASHLTLEEFIELRKNRG